jgi:predicted dehydrogenase
MLKAGFIGFGRMGITHFSILNTHPSVEIAAVCDQSSTMLNILKKYVDIKTYSDHKKMMEEENLDFVVVSTPSDSHAEIIKFALDKNIHTFTEKPLAMTENEGQEILSCLAGRSLVNQAGYVNRFNEVFMEVKKLLGSGIIGEVKSFSSEMYGATILKDTKSNWRGKKNTGGGCMYEFASHCIDLVLYFFGKPDRVMGSVMQSIYSSQVEDQVMSTFVYDRGFSGTMMANWSDESYRKPANIFTIFGTKGKIIADKHAYKIYLRDKDPGNGFHNGWNTRYITDFAEPVRYYVRGNEFTRQLDYFIECIEKKETFNLSSFSEAFKTDIVMEEITKDAGMSVAEEKATHQASPVLTKELKRSSMWRRIFKSTTIG